LKWHEFDWKSYIAKDIQPEDLADPITRFGIHLIRSNEIGVNRTVPDNRYLDTEKTDSSFKKVKQKN
jgi:hypothetical protein